MKANPEGMKFPFFVDIHGWKVLLVGGGTIGTRRAGVLHRFGVSLTVICPNPSKEIREMAEAGKIRLEERVFSMEDLNQETWKMVLTTTDDEELNREIVSVCRERQIPVNNSSDQTQCDFFFPAIIEGQGMVIGLVSDGSDHGSVRRVAAQIRKEYGEE